MVKKAPKKAFCVTCKKKKDLRAPKLKTMKKNGGKYYLGKCPRGHKVSVIVEGPKGGRRKSTSKKSTSKKQRIYKRNKKNFKTIKAAKKDIAKKLNIHPNRLKQTNEKYKKTFRFVLK